MNGIDHYREAERLLGLLKNVAFEGPELATTLKAAQVHATLALAAASVQYTAAGYTETVHASDWRRMLQTPTNQKA